MELEQDTKLSFFHPLIGRWFRERVGVPTGIQRAAWAEIVRGQHVLVCAPTGSGKTLTAFLRGFNQLATGAWSGGGVRILYVSPLKALNNDVQRNVLKPLAELRETFEQAGEPFPDIRVLTRSGDTPGEERRRMIRNPPAILITTPESLNLLLTSRSGRSMLTGVATVILDEVHAVLDNKRGTHLITAVERLVLLSGEFQRIALSATVNPPARAADFVGGFRQTTPPDGRYEKRRVAIIQSREAKQYQITVAFPSEAIPGALNDSWWPALIEAFRKIIAGHRSTLLFANSRRMTEKVTRMINEGEQQPIAYAHHGSLSRELRLAVEQKLRQGELKAIVATNSLELGIDIGSLDEVILIQPPRSVSSAVQRAGRSGHAVGEKSRAVIFPIHGRDFLDSAVVAKAIADQDIEEAHPVESPLDVLAQVILSMTSVETWNIDALYSFFKTCHPFRDLSRSHFDMVIGMLSGRYADTRKRELKARISVDRIDNTVRAHAGVPFLLAVSGGTIPDRGYFELRVRDSRARIGELDEEFVWERSVGDTFALGTQLWRIEKISRNDVEVTPVRAAAGMFPFWRAEEQSRSFHFSERIGLFLEYADSRLDGDDFRRELMDAYAMEGAAADQLIAFLKLQKNSAGSLLPHRHRLFLEQVEAAVSGDFQQVILHTFWGGRVNRPFAIALQQAWEEREHAKLQIIHDDDALLLLIPRERSVDVLSLLSPETVEGCLRRGLEQSGFFGARFRENAERALLLPKSSFKRRMPLWLIRLRAKELLSAVQSYRDFPIVLETWRTCLRDEFDLENLKRLLHELRDGAIRVTRSVTRAASPFAARLIWKQTNQLMYEDDTPLSPRGPSLRPDLVQQLLFSSELRPKIPPELIRMLDGKLKRTAPGYAPGSPAELLDWIKDRLLMPEPEWKELVESVRRDQGADALEWLGQNRAKTAWVRWPGTSYPLLIGLESLPGVLVAFRLLFDDIALEPVSAGQEREEPGRRARHFLAGSPVPPEDYDLSVFLSAWLQFYGPVRKETVTSLLGITPERMDEALEPLLAAQSIVLDRFREGSGEIELCDTENLEVLLRMARRYRRPSFQPRPAGDLPLFLAAFQGIVPRGRSRGDMQSRLEQLFGWPAPVNAWEEYILPARIENYRNEWLDAVISENNVVWFGCGQRRIGLAFREDLDLFRDPRGRESAGDGDELDRLIPDRRGRYSFLDITDFSHLDTARANDLLWSEAWK